MLRGALRFARVLSTDAATETYGALAFTRAEQEAHIPEKALRALRAAADRGTAPPRDALDSAAEGLRAWAASKGVTHAAHSFQPLTGGLAEKHDAFLGTKRVEGGGAQGSRVGLDAFGTSHGVAAVSGYKSGDLCVGEPDGSSFPSGGLRETSEARGYTVWDARGPVWVRPNPDGDSGGTLVLPSVFLSHNGDALDHRLPMVRAEDALNRAATRMMRAIGEDGVEACHATLGIEQEYFLVDSKYLASRPDLAATGRTLLGRAPPKGQELDDHYFSVPEPRVQAYMADTEREFWRYGIPAKTRHAEVAPGQFEMAPIFESAATAVDHNNLTMQIMVNVARDHGLVFLAHEKPFAGVNGSGKHNNYAVATDTGINLFDPTADPLSARPFLASLAAFMRACDLHADVLRSSIAVPGNDFRLGAAEAPPAIISLYLGDLVDGAVRAIIAGALESGSAAGAPGSASGAAGATFDLPPALPEVARLGGDRNRTSTLAFTGNRFEFRAVGSTQNCAQPFTALAAAHTESLNHLAGEIEARVAAGASRDAAFAAVVRDTFEKHVRVVFNGDGYTEEWRLEAERRGLPNLATVPDAVELLASDKNIALFDGILNERELRARQIVQLEQYVTTIEIEARSVVELARTRVAPAAARTLKQSSEAIAAARSAGVQPGEYLVSRVESISADLNGLLSAADRIESLIASAPEIPHGAEPKEVAAASATRAKFLGEKVLRGAMAQLREHSDSLEGTVDAEHWTLPGYSDMLFDR